MRRALRARVHEPRFTRLLEALGPIAKEPRARERLEVEVRDQEASLDRARDDEADARARVEANTVDAEQVAAEAERLAVLRDQLAQSQRRHRVLDATLRAIERAETATMKTATRYLEGHMVRDVSTVTGGRYRRVRVDDKSLDIDIHAPERGDWVPVSLLSQGTLDLVYLTARLGLVRLVTGDRRPPLVFDDPFVTLDDDRATRARYVTGTPEAFRLGIPLGKLGQPEAVAAAIAFLASDEANHITGVILNVDGMAQLS